jgi:pimeloyl-ACP methyl ester carboxylesterase
LANGDGLDKDHAMVDITPFSINVPQEVLDDLHDRLRRTRFTRDLGNHEWRYGFRSTYLRELVAYWLDQFDWRAQEAEMNSYAQFRAAFDGVPIHFIHERGRGPSPIPIVLTHGWPWSFWDFRSVIGPLTDPAAHGGDAADSFDVIIPSLPGFTFSSPLERTGVNFSVAADMWADLMTSLGYDRFAAWGADIGTFVTAQLGYKYTERVLAPTNPEVLTLFNVERPWADIVRLPLPDDPAVRRAVIQWEADHSGHVGIHSIEPETLSAAMVDSPAGMAAWIVERRRTWSSCGGDVESLFSKDDLLTLVSLYWVTETFDSAIRMYAEAWHHWWEPVPGKPEMPARTGLAGGQAITAAPRRFHFGPAETPEPIIDSIRETYRSLR